MTLHVPVLAQKNKALTMWRIPACIAVCGGIILAVWSHKIDNRWRFVPWVSVKEKRNGKMTSWRVSSDDCIISNKSAVSYRDADLYHVARQLYFFTGGFMTRWKELCAETDKTPVYSPSVLTNQRGFGWDLMSRANQCPARWLWLMPLKKQSVIMVLRPPNRRGGEVSMHQPQLRSRWPSNFEALHCPKVPLLACVPESPWGEINGAGVLWK